MYAIRSYYVPFRNPIGEFVIACTNWIVYPARRLVPSLAGLDLATWLAAWLVQGCALYVALALRGWDASGRIGAAFAALAALAFLDLLRFSAYILMFAIIVQVVIRITSYNVCYTKLLRTAEAHRPAARAPAAALQRSA